MIIYSFRFFPAAGRLSFEFGTSGMRGVTGAYWCCSTSAIMSSWIIACSTGGLQLQEAPRAMGYSVRCVAKVISNYICF